MRMLVSLATWVMTVHAPSPISSLSNRPTLVGSASEGMTATTVGGEPSPPTCDTEKSSATSEDASPSKYRMMLDQPVALLPSGSDGCRASIAPSVGSLERMAISVASMIAKLALLMSS